MVNLKSTFERVVCINLDRRPDRWEEFQREWARVEGCFGELERVRAVDGEKVPPPEWYRGNRGASSGYPFRLGLRRHLAADPQDRRLAREASRVERRAN